MIGICFSFVLSLLVWLNFCFFCYLVWMFHLYFLLLFYLLEKHSTLWLPLSPSSPLLFWYIRELEWKNIFTDHQTSNIIYVFVAIKGIFSGPFIFWKSYSEEKFPRVYLINVGTCLFAYSQNRHNVMDKTIIKWPDDIRTNSPCCNILL